MATVKLRLDTRAKSNGLFNVKIAVYHKNEKKFFGTNEDLTKKDFEQIKGAISGEINLRKSNKIIVKERLEKRLQEAQEICKELSNRFSYFQFKERYKDAKNKSDSLEELFDDHISMKKQDEKIGTAVSYNNAKQSFKAFAPGSSITDVTHEFLNKYVRYMQSKGSSKTTIGIYLRSLRTIFNNGIKKGLVNNLDYPFTDFKIPSSESRKIALEAEHLVKLWKYIPATKQEEKARDFFFISLFANGMNFKDIIMLRQSSIDDDELIFERQKISDRSNKSIKVPITLELKELIVKNRIHRIGKNPLLFDVINDQDTPEIRDKKLRQFIKNTNKYLKRIASKIELPNGLSTVVARHSWATTAMREGINVAEISKALGHSSIRTTENYLGDIAKTKRLENASKISKIVNG